MTTRRAQAKRIAARSKTATVGASRNHGMAAQSITPFLWFDNQAEEAVKFYASIFKNSKVGKIARYGPQGEKVSGQPAGSVMTIEFRLAGQDFIALNGGPQFKFTEAISLVVNCKTQAEV